MLISKFDNTNILSDIKIFEKKYNFDFPKIYRSFLLKYNGGETPKTKFKINRVGSDLRAFYGFGNANEHYHFNTIEKDIHFNEWLQENIIPIATNVFGDYIMIGIKDENSGKVFFRYHDRANKVIELADNFESFINKCKSEKIGHVKSIEERKELLIKNGNAENITDDWIEVWQAEIDKYANMHQEELTIDKVE